MKNGFPDYPVSWHSLAFSPVHGVEFVVIFHQYWDFGLIRVLVDPAAFFAYQVTNDEQHESIRVHTDSYPWSHG